MYSNFGNDNKWSDNAYINGKSAFNIWQTPSYPQDNWNNNERTPPSWQFTYNKSGGILNYNNMYYNKY
mgnify:CR=1 FL=1